MCHSITWYYSLCLHDEYESGTKVPCAKALRRGYECMDQFEDEFRLPMAGRCLECKMKCFISRQNVIRTLKTRQRLADINAAFGYNEDEESGNYDSEPENESQINLNMPSYREFARPIPTDTVDKLEEWAELRDGLARKSQLVIPTSPIISHQALVEYVEGQQEEEEEEEEKYLQETEAERGSRWRSWIPRPTRLLRRRSYRKLASGDGDDASEKKPLIESAPKKRSCFKSLIPFPGKQV